MADENRNRARRNKAHKSRHKSKDKYTCRHPKFKDRKKREENKISDSTENGSYTTKSSYSLCCDIPKEEEKSTDKWKCKCKFTEKNVTCACDQTDDGASNEITKYECCENLKKELRELKEENRRLVEEERERERNERIKKLEKLKRKLLRERKRKKKEEQERLRKERLEKEKKKEQQDKRAKEKQKDPFAHKPRRCCWGFFTCCFKNKHYEGEEEDMNEEEKERRKKKEAKKKEMEKAKEKAKSRNRSMSMDDDADSADGADGAGRPSYAQGYGRTDERTGYGGSGYPGNVYGTYGNLGDTTCPFVALPKSCMLPECKYSRMTRKDRPTGPPCGLLEEPQGPPPLVSFWEANKKSKSVYMKD